MIDPIFGDPSSQQWKDFQVGRATPRGSCRTEAARVIRLCWALGMQAHGAHTLTARHS